MSKFNLDFDLLDEDTIGKIVKGSIIPRPIAWITSLNETKSVNLAPFSYFTMLSPTLLLVSFQKDQVSQKDTFINIIREKEAVIHIVDESLIAAMDKTAKPLEKNISEVDLVNLTLSSSLKIKTPGIKEALIRFEVVLEQTLSLKNYNKTAEDADLVILRVVAASLDKKVYDKDSGYILVDNLKPIARLAGVDYAGIKKLDFKREF
ncbi:MAG: flavin reductase family protein [Erysipelothrix sp.]|nr:flavin reductase family protein [Erysipelothrix sp.]